MPSGAGARDVLSAVEPRELEVAAMRRSPRLEQAEALLLHVQVHVQVQVHVHVHVHVV